MPSIFCPHNDEADLEVTIELALRSWTIIPYGARIDKVNAQS